jgi:hypothetical protein
MWVQEKEQPHGSSESTSAHAQAQPPQHAIAPPPQHAAAPPPQHAATAPPPRQHVHTLTWLLAYCCWKNSSEKAT